jgi:hypothetical protein
MGLWKCTWFFEGLQDATLGAGSAVGWTETWGLNDGPNVNIDNCFTNVDVLAYTAARQQCLSVAYRISFLRITAIPQAGNVPVRLVKVQSLPNVQGAASLFGHGGAQVQCCVLADLMKLPVGFGDKVHHRKFLIRGLPPDVINGNVLNTAAPNWPRFVTFLNFVANKPTGGAANPGRATNLGIVYGDPAFPKRPMPALTVGVTTPRQISFADITAYMPGDQIRITGWSGLNGVQYNRAWNWISSAVVGPDNIATFGKSRFDMEPGTSAFPNPGQVQRIRFLAGPLDQYAIIGLRNKRTGGVFHRLRGRSPRKVRP